MCVAIVASLTREVAVRSFVCDAHETDPAVIHGHHKTLNQQCMLAQALTSYLQQEVSQSIISCGIL